MAYSIQTLLNDISGVVHGTTINKIPNVYGAINRAARAVLLDVDPKETQRILSLGLVFNGVQDYPAPVDMKGDRIIDLRLTAGQNPSDEFTQTYSTDFNANVDWSWDNKIYTQWNTGIKTLRVQAPWLTAPVTLTDTSTTTGWSVGGGASGITLDSINNPAGGGDLMFNLLAGQSSGYLENSTLNPVDYTNYLNVSNGFLWVYLPSATAVTAIDVRWGTNSSNYYHLSVNATQQGTVFQVGWNLISLPWNTATVVGSPTITSTQYTRVTFTYDSTLQTGVRICNFTFNQGFYFNAVYYSKYMFRSAATGAFQETVTDANDNSVLINLDTDSYNLLFNKLALYVAQSLQGADADYDAEFWEGEYANALKRYKALNLSEAIPKGARYYSTSNKGYNRYGPSIWPH